MQLTHGFALEPVAIACAVLVVNAADGDAEVIDVGVGHEKEANRRPDSLERAGFTRFELGCKP
jgi:hypothetical protein